MIEKSEVVAPVPDQATDPLIYRIVVVALASIGMLTLIGALVLAFFSRSMPEGALVLGSTAVGAMAGLLAPAPTRQV